MTETLLYLSATLLLVDAEMQYVSQRVPSTAKEAVKHPPKAKLCRETEKGSAPLHHTSDQQQQASSCPA